MQTGATITSDMSVGSSVRYTQLLDVIQVNLSGPYGQCQFKDVTTFPITTDPERLQTALQSETLLNDTLRHNGVTSYSHQHYPRLTELSDMLEAHPLGKGGWDGGTLTANFNDALRKLDSIQETTRGTPYFLVEQRKYQDDDTVGRLTLIRSTIGRITLHPALRVLRQWPGSDDTQNEARYSCDLIVQLSPSEIIDIGQKYIVPFFYGNKNFHGSDIGARWPIEFVGKRVNDRNRDHVVMNDHAWPDLRLHTDQREMLEVIGQQLNGHIYKAVRQMVREAAKGR